MKCLLTPAVMLTLFLAATLPAAEAPSRAAKPNVVFVLVDDKYLAASSESHFHREMHRFPSIFFDFGIAWKCGQFRAIQWN